MCGLTSASFACGAGAAHARIHVHVNDLIYKVAEKSPLLVSFAYSDDSDPDRPKLLED